VNDKQQAILNEVLAVLEMGAKAAQQIGNQSGNADVAGGAALADLLLVMAQKAVSAVEAHQGEPIDLSLLHAIDPVA
jgi:hypothetical protein